MPVKLHFLPENLLNKSVYVWPEWFLLTSKMKQVCVEFKIMYGIKFRFLIFKFM